MKKQSLKTRILWAFHQGGGGSTESRAIHCAPNVWTTFRAFTMAEILLSLTIIGVVAAITLPSLTGNINERTWNTQRKALYARFSQAIALMPSLNGYGTLIEGNNSTSAVDTGAETFVTEGLSKVLKINNICNNEHLEDCGLNKKITTLNGSIITFPEKMSELNPLLTSVSVFGGFSAIDTKAAAFETVNGESIAIFYNPNCQMDMNERSTVYHGYYYFIYPKICANFVFDLNGNKGPNTVGKDIGFMTALYSSDSIIVAPQLPTQMAAGTNAKVKQQEAVSICKNQDGELRLPNIDELVAIFVNQNLLYGSTYTASTAYWSSNLAPNKHAWGMGMESAAVWCYNTNTTTWSVHCVKR